MHGIQERRITILYVHQCSIKAVTGTVKTERNNGFECLHISLKAQYWADVYAQL